MRAGLVPRNDVWLREVFGDRLQKARALTDPGYAYEEGVELLADFKGLADTTELEAWLAAQRETKAVRRYLAAEKKSIKEDEQWRERLAVAINQALHGIPEPAEGRDTPADFFASSQPLQTTLEGSTGDSSGEFGPPRTKMPGLERRETDRFALLQREVQNADRQRDRNIAVRRAIRAIDGNLRQEAEDKFFLKKYNEAGELLNIATILRPEVGGTYFRLAWVRALQGRKNEACLQMANATKRGFHDEALLGELTRALSSDGDKGKTMLEPMFITTKREVSTSFGLGLTIYADPETRTLVRILVTSVTQDSDAEAWGLGQGEEILRVNGRSVRSFSVDFSPEGEFARLFCKRPNGESISLEIVDASGGKPRTVSLTQGRAAGEVLHPWLHND